MIISNFELLACKKAQSFKLCHFQTFYLVLLLMQKQRSFVTNFSYIYIDYFFYLSQFIGQKFQNDVKLKSQQEVPLVWSTSIENNSSISLSPDKLYWCVQLLAGELDVQHVSKAAHFQSQSPTLTIFYFFFLLCILFCIFFSHYLHQLVSLYSIQPSTEIWIHPCLPSTWN